jgi:uncharacterized membrane protein
VRRCFCAAAASQGKRRAAAHGACAGRGRRASARKKGAFYMRTTSIKKLAAAAMLAALTCAATMVVQIPTPMNGYVHPGDSIVMLCGFVLGPIWGAAAAGIGSALADILAGYFHYAVATLIIKALSAFCAGIVWHMLTKNKTDRIIPALAAGFCGAVPMVLGYFLYEALLLGNGWGAAAAIPGNILQGVFGMAVGALLIELLERVPQMHRLFEQLRK